MTTEKLASELADEVLKLRAENAKLKDKAEEWKHEAKCHHEIAVGEMGEVKRLKGIIDKCIFVSGCHEKNTVEARKDAKKLWGLAGRLYEALRETRHDEWTLEARWAMEEYEQAKEVKP